MGDQRKTVSLKINMVLNMTKGIMGILMPLITFPYVSRTLGVENIGRVSFVNSIISYFALLAALGSKAYAISVGPRYRNDKEQMTRFAESIFTINMLFTGISYVLLYTLMVLIPKFHGYIALFVVFSVQIILTTIGVDWINDIYEDYFYITVRTIIFYIMQLVLLFTFVRTEKDLFKYAVVLVISSNGANILNHFYTKKYCKVHLRKDVEWKSYMAPIVLLFATQAMVTIYVSSDITILGFMCDDVSVGIYHVSVKIYTIIKTVVASMVAVSIPRLSSMYGQRRWKMFHLTAQETYHAMLTICIPAMIGLILLRRDIIVLLAGPEYIDAVYPLTILSIAIFFCIGAYFWGQAILVPIGHEGILFKITMLSAVMNIALNLLLIPLWKENAAACTTLLAEAITFMMCRYYGKRYVQFDGQVKIGIKILLGCLGIMAVYLLMKMIGVSGKDHIAAMVFCSTMIYILIEIIVKNELFYNGFHTMRMTCKGFLNMIHK